MAWFCLSSFLLLVSPFSAFSINSPFQQIFNKTAPLKKHLRNWVLILNSAKKRKYEQKRSASSQQCRIRTYYCTTREMAYLYGKAYKGKPITDN